MPFTGTLCFWNIAECCFGPVSEKVAVLEKKLCKFWGKGNYTDPYHSWQIGSFDSKKVTFIHTCGSSFVLRFNHVIDFKIN
jgi:hypothetical protein